LRFDGDSAGINAIAGHDARQDLKTVSESADTTMKEDVLNRLAVLFDPILGQAAAQEGPTIAWEFPLLARQPCGAVLAFLAEVPEGGQKP
jgi:hypothetical protein